jgi:hypothetical protein
MTRPAGAQGIPKVQSPEDESASQAADDDDRATGESWWELLFEP